MRYHHAVTWGPKDEQNTGKRCIACVKVEWLWEVWDIKAEKIDQEPGARSCREVLINGHMKQLDTGLKEGDDAKVSVFG